MGMFDDLVCHVRCDGAEGDPPYHCQTKDLDCALWVYEITEAGRLIQHYHEHELTPEEELPCPDMPYIGCIRTKKGSERVIDLNYHGMLNFYGEAGDFYAKFTDGAMVRIEVIKELEPEPPHAE